MVNTKYVGFVVIVFPSHVQCDLTFICSNHQLLPSVFRWPQLLCLHWPFFS